MPIRFNGSGRKVYFSEEQAKAWSATGYQRMKSDPVRYAAYLKRKKSEYAKRGCTIKLKNWKRNYYRIKLANKPSHRVLGSLRSRLRKMVKGVPSGSARILVGCTPEFLKIHLESKFKDGMSWDNYGIKGWHVDHIKPCDLFDFSDENHIKECFHYTNLQPLWYWENIAKGNKFKIAS